MRKGKLMSRILRIALVFAMIGSMFGALSDTASATSEKTTIRVTDSSPWFTKGSYSGHPEYWFTTSCSGHSYIWTYVGGMSWLGGSPSQPDAWAEFRPYLSQPGKYEVYACFYADPQNSSQVPYTVYYDGGSTTVKVNEYASSYCTWREVKLGTWNFVAGANTRVVVTDATGEYYNGYTSLNVDTIKFVKVNQPPTCSVTAEPRSGQAPLTVTFYLTASDPDGSISAWLLDVDGDGNPNYSGTGSPPATKTHTYTAPSPPSGYSVMLVVGDNSGETAWDTETVVVGTNSPPTCSLSASPSSGPAPLAVTFTMSASDSDGSISTWALDVNFDGVVEYSGSGYPPSTRTYTYSAPGSYTALLMVSDDKDAIASAFKPITVQPPAAPQVTAVAPPQPVVQPTRQPFSILGSGFVEGTEVTLKAPDDELWVIPRPENPNINVSPTKIDVNAGFYIPGTWQVWVTNPDSQNSNVFNFAVDIDEDRVDGIDVSHWQGDINWSQVSAAGYEFAFVKATEGVGWTDEKVSINMNGGHAAGVLVGAYHFARPDLGNSGAAEAEWFVSVAGDYMTEGYLRPVLDLEMGHEMGWATLSNWVHDFMGTVKSQTGVEPILYTGWYKNYLDISVAQYDLWISQWRDPSLEPDIGIWDDWAFWQYSNQGTVSGIVGDVDLDLFNGDMIELDTFVIGSAQPAWTFMVYLDGDDVTVEPAYVYNFNLMELAASNPNVNIIVQFDRIPGYDTSEGDWSSTRRYKVKYDTDISKFASYTLGVDYWDLGELNMADPNTLVDFVQWAKSNYPADHYFLALVNHGGGWGPTGPPSEGQAVPTGILWDYTNGDYMSTAQLGSALHTVTSGGAEQLDVLFLDACLMQMVEVGYEIRDYAAYAVASENLGWAPGPYHSYIASITSTTTALQLAATVVNEYHDYTILPGAPHTMSGIDLAQLGGLASEVNSFAQVLADALPSYKTQIENSRTGCQKFDTNNSRTIDNNDSYIDLYHFAYLIKQNIADATIQSAAQNVMTAVSTTVKAEQHQSGSYIGYTYDLDNAHGISLYFPDSESHSYYSDYNSDNLGFVAHKSWDEFLAAFFAPTYTLTISSTSGGSVTTPGEGTFGPHNPGQVVNLVATPASGYRFVNWTGNVGTIANPTAASTTITMNGNYSITANFAINEYTLTISSTSGGSVTTPGEGPFGPYNPGDVVNLVATAEPSYHFTGWTGDTSTIANPTAASTTITMNGNYSITANFAINEYTLTISSTSGGSVTTPGEGPFGPYNPGDVVNLVATAEPSYHFTGWTGDTSTIANPTAASTTITMNGNYSITANFAINEYTLTISSTSGGSVTTPGEGPFGPYNPGDVVNLVATAEPSYHFTGWTGDTSTIANPNAPSTTVTMNDNYSITANFAIVVEPFWAVSMVADAGVEGSNADLEFGIHPDATDGYDYGIDLLSPPPGPGALFEAYFSIVHTLFPRMNKDFRGEIPNEWTLEVKSTDQDIELTWDATDIPSELCALMDTRIEKMNMKAQGSVVLSAGEYTITISVSEEVEIQLSLQAGWNMVSVPVTPADDSTSAVFPGVAGVFAWNATSRSYYVPTAIDPEKGYWVAVTGNTTITISGTPIETWTTDIKAGWNMIGSVSANASIIEPNDNPNDSVIPPAYWWDPVSKSYLITTDIEPAKGYWVASVNDCVLTL